MTAGDALVTRATLWAWLARAFWYPEPAFVATLRDPVEGASLDQAAGRLGLASAWDRLRLAVDALQGAPLDLDEEYTYLFERTVRCSPHEGSYPAAPAAERTQPLANLGSFYAAFGLQVSQERRELPDHISMEQEFMGVLLAKEAYALSQGWLDRADICAQARGRFAAEHLGRWLNRFSRRLSEEARLDFYPAAAAVALALLAHEPAPTASAPRATET